MPNPSDVNSRTLANSTRSSATSDPASVGQTTGIVSYELGPIVTYNGDKGDLWDAHSYIPNIRAKAGTPAQGPCFCSSSATEC